jgi:hypothetical protein
MTDERARVDLSAAAPTDAETDRIMRAVASRLAARTQRRTTPLGLVASPLARWIAVAALLLAAASLRVSRSRSPSTLLATDIIAEWATNAHVPDNADLLAAFQGYVR